MSTLYHGIDVSKDELVVDGEIHGCLPNSDQKILSLLKRLAKLDGEIHVVCEATGGYEQKLVKACHGHGFLVSVVDPKRVRSFAKAHGKLAKTDRIDAGMILAFARSVKPAPSLRRSASREQLNALITRRTQVKSDITRNQVQTKFVADAVVIKTTKTIIDAMKAALTAIEAEIEAVVGNDKELSEQADDLKEKMIGVGPIVSATLLATMPELGKVNRGTIANLCGLAPFNHDSGTKQGRRYIQGGRMLPRNAMYMAALVASRHCPALSKTYQDLLTRGKPKKVALVALMRRMVIIANNIIKDYYDQKEQVAFDSTIPA